MVIMEVAPARPVGRPATREARPANYYSPEAVAKRQAYMIAYKLANKEHLKAYYKEWRLAHRDQMNQSNRDYTARLAQAKRLAREAQTANVVPEN